MKYDPKYCQMLIDHGKKGLSFETFAAEIGVNRDTLYDWAKKHEEFERAKDLAQAARELLLEKLLIGQSSGKVRGGNAASLIFTAKNVLKWRDTVHQEITGAGDFKIDLNYPLSRPLKKEDE